MALIVMTFPDIGIEERVEPKGALSLTATPARVDLIVAAGAARIKRVYCKPPNAQCQSIGPKSGSRFWDKSDAQLFESRASYPPSNDSI